MSKYLSKIALLLVSVIAVFSGGCTAIGFLLTPTWHEEKIPAEYSLKDYQDQKILVFVDESAGANAGLTMKRKLARTYEKYLVGWAKIDGKSMVTQEGLDYLQTHDAEFSLMTPAQVGKKLGAGLVLYVLIEDYELYAMGGDSYYSGSMLSRTALFDSETGNIVWPAERRGEEVEVVLDLDTNRQSGVDRLATATARSVIRKLHDCPRDEYRVSDTSMDVNEW